MASPHQNRIRRFMKQIPGQETPETPNIPDEATRKLRASLILEEALETIEALGFTTKTVYDRGWHDDSEDVVDTIMQNIRFFPDKKCDITLVADGCADISVVTQGTLIAFGLDDEPIFEAVDASNLNKFGPGSYSREDGKWMKPPDWKAPDLASVIRNQGYVRSSGLTYLASPYSARNLTGVDMYKLEERRFNGVCVAAARLINDFKMVVYSPIAHNHPLKKVGTLPGHWEFWEYFDRVMLSLCTRFIVYTLDGWKESVGIQAEIQLAEAMGMEIEYLDPLTFEFS